MHVQGGGICESQMASSTLKGFAAPRIACVSPTDSISGVSAKETGGVGVLVGFNLAPFAETAAFFVGV